MDMIRLAGGKPANLLDAGCSASPQTFEEGFRAVLSDKNVNAILVNIFGGIIQAAKSTDVILPVIVRLEETNAGEAQKKLDEQDLRDATRKEQGVPASA